MCQAVPKNVRIIGAQPADWDELGIGLSGPVRKAARRSWPKSETSFARPPLAVLRPYKEG